MPESVTITTGSMYEQSGRSHPKDVQRREEHLCSVKGPGLPANTHTASPLAVQPLAKPLEYSGVKAIQFYDVPTVPYLHERTSRAIRYLLALYAAEAKHVTVYIPAGTSREFLPILIKGGLLHTVRGSKGGTYTKVAAAELQLLTVMDMFEHPYGHVKDKAIEGLRQALRRTFGKITFSQLLEMYEEEDYEGV